MTLGFEYRYQWLENWQLALFTDVGRAYRDTSEPERIGAGFGIRWISPIGPVSMDVALPIEDGEQSSPRLHIYMGPVI